MNEVDIVEIYRRRRKWRWRYKAGGNHRIMATGAEAYENFDDILESVARVLDLKPIPVYVRALAHQRVSRNSGWPDVLVVVTQ